MAEPIVSEAMLRLVTKALNTEKGIRIEFPSYGAAVNYRQRYYKVRARVLKQQPDSDWNTLSCIIENAVQAKREPEKPCWLMFIPVDAQVDNFKVEEIE